MIRVDVSALERSAGRFRKLIADAALSGLALKAAEHLSHEAAARTPVDTGRLRGGWTAVSTGPRSAVAKNPVPYASFVEFDTRHWISRDIVPGQLFMRRAMAETEAALPGMVQNQLTEVVGRWFGD